MDVYQKQYFFNSVLFLFFEHLFAIIVHFLTTIKENTLKHLLLVEFQSQRL